MERIVLGLERLAADRRAQRLVQSRKIGLLAHPASTTVEFVHALDVLLGQGAKVEILFGPEHGFGGERQDMEPVTSGRLANGKRPLVSLYGNDVDSLRPKPAHLQGLDAVVVDMFDIGTRYYTFAWTAVLCLRVCHEVGVECIVLDRPNPLGGEVVEGARQHPDYLSFVGLHPVSNRHGLTLGELVTLVARAEGTADVLTVVPMLGWQRSMLFSDTGLPWIMPSPNMPTWDTALVYPGQCLIEGTTASEGRGTTRPFELVGAPGIDEQTLAARLESMELEGVRFRPTTFKPGFQKHAGEVCGGVQLHVTDVHRFSPYKTGIGLLLALKAEWGGRFAWRDKPYEFVTDRPAIDLLTGGCQVREMIDQGAGFDDISATYLKGEREFAEFRREFFLYE